MCEKKKKKQRKKNKRVYKGDFFTVECQMCILHFGAWKHWLSGKGGVFKSSKLKGVKYDVK